MKTFIDHIAINTPDGPFEYVGLAVSGAVIASAWRTVGPPFTVFLLLLALVAHVLIGDLALPISLAFVAVGLRIVSRRRGRALDIDRNDLALQAVVILLGYSAYEFVRMHTEGSFSTALANALDIIGFEKGLGLYFESDLQQLVIESEALTRAFNTTYSFLFLAVTVSVLVWLYGAGDGKNYRLYRNALGVSVVLAGLTIALYPVAPPRLVPEAQIVDTVVELGRTHKFANEYAAVPSLHVGWMALAGYVMARHIGGWRGATIGVLPGAIMGTTVVVTGNHYWVDGAIGTLYALGPALAMVHGPALPDIGDRGHGWLLRAGSIAMMNGRTRFTSLSMGGLLGYLVVGQILSPGFTDYWDYMVLQMTVTLIVLLAGEVIFEKQGGLSWVTHVIAITTGYADVFGTAGHLYDRIDEYDKVTHFFGTAAVTAGVYDSLRALRQRGASNFWVNERLIVAAGLGFMVGVGWEIWELIGDRVLQTSRIGGWWDTSNDLVSDAAGALITSYVLWRRDLVHQERAQAAIESALAADDAPQSTTPN